MVAIFFMIQLIICFYIALESRSIKAHVKEVNRLIDRSLKNDAIKMKMSLDQYKAWLARENGRL